MTGAGEGEPAPAAPEVRAITVGGAPSQIAVAGGLVWTLDLTERRLTAIAPQSGQVVRRVRIGARDDLATALGAGAGRVWVSLARPDRPSLLSRITPATGAARHTRLGSGAPGDIAVGPDAVWLLGEGGLDRVQHGAPAGRARPEPARAVVSGATDVASGYGSTWVLRRAAAGERGGEGAARAVVERVDQTSGEVVGRRAVPGAATAVATGLGAVWIANGCGGGWVRAPVGAGPAVCTRSGGGIADIAVGDGAVWGADRDDSAVLRIDPRTGAVAERIPLPNRPSAVTVGAGAAWAVSRRGVVYRIGPPAPEVAPT